MKTLLLSLATAGLLALSACGGENECDHLSETCAMCTNEAQRTECNNIANGGESEACEVVHAMWDNICGPS
jgi:hypothetical protein